MAITGELQAAKKVSWGSIIGGVVTVLAVSLLLSTLGTSLGFTLVDPLSDSDPVNGAGTAVAVWSALSIIISLLLGGFVAGRLAANDGAIHGFLVWATALIVATLLGGALLGGALKATGSAIGSVASASGSVISGAGSAVGSGISGLASAGSSAFEKIGIDTDWKPEELSSEVVTALKKSDIKSLQPDYVQQQLQAAKKDISQAAKELVTNSDNADNIIKGLGDKLKKHGEALTADVDRESLTKALAANTKLTQPEINKTVDNLIAAKDKAAKEVNERIAQAEQQIEQAKQQYQELKQQAREKAADAAAAIARSALWAFVALLLGAVLSALSGAWGSRTGRRHVLR